MNALRRAWPLLVPVLCACGPTPAEVRSALISVEYHLHELDEPADLDGSIYAPLDLDEAARILRSDARDPFGESRRRRAIVMLAMGLPQAVDHDHRDAIRSMLGDQADDFDGSATGDEMVSMLEKLLYEDGPPVPECTVEPKIPIPRFPNAKNATTKCKQERKDWKKGLIWVQTTVEVERSDTFDDLARSLDPQNWDATYKRCGKRCNPFFEAAFVANPKDWSEHPNPPDAGTSWGHRFFERYHMSLGPIYETDLQTGLRIDSTLKSDQSYGFEYCLEESIGGRSRSGPSEIQGKIDVDEGYLLATVHGKGAVVTADKRVHFAGWTDKRGTKWDPVVNFYSKLMMLAMGRAHAESVCCVAP